MKPVLIVEGKQWEVIGVHLYDNKPYKVEVKLDTPMESLTYYDLSWKTTYVEDPLRIDLSKHLFDLDELKIVKEIYNALDKVIADLSSELKRTSIEHTEACLKYPYSSESILRKYALIQREQIGLIGAQDIVHGFMEDDVDLSGGDTNVTE